MIADPVKPILDPDAVAERADDLAAQGLNGLRLALVSLGPPAGADEALVEVFFLNPLHVGDVLAAATATPTGPRETFWVRGGQRLPAGSGPGQVQCTGVTAGSNDENGDLVSLVLTLSPIGDYSTYTLELAFDPARIDPFFAEIPFKFRPGCFTNDCAPAWKPGRAPRRAPAIDYLAKDYDSFRHALITAMMERVPGWLPTSEADLDQVLIDLFAAAADELSDYQDRVMAEAYLGTARKRVSLTRHARLMDYHVHQGNQASTWLVVTVEEGAAPFTLDEDLVVWAGHPDRPEERIWFATRERHLPSDERVELAPLLNELRLHTWANAVPALGAGSTSADLVSAVPGAGQAEADTLAALVNGGTLRRLVLEEVLNPRTGRVNGRDPRRRQLLRLLPDAETRLDPLTGAWMTRVRWRGEDQLRSDYAFTTTCPDGRFENVSVFRGNVVRAHQGRPLTVHFYEPGTPLPLDGATDAHRHYTRWSLAGTPRGVLCPLPFAPLAYLPTPPGGEQPPRSTLRVEVEISGVREPWDEVISLVHSDDSAEEGDHFVVETDERRASVLRFGDGVNGRWFPDDAVVHCELQVGAGSDGNVGADAVTSFLPLGAPLATAVRAVRNPFDVVDGRDPEPAHAILRNAPEAYRARQLRAVTLADYVKRAEEVEGVARAVARYAWTGSWRTVRLVIDPAGTTELADELRRRVAGHLEAVRLIGEDLEIRAPRFVPLAVEVEVCLHPDYWVQDVRFAIEQELSDGWTPDGRRGLFHPDLWTFGQTLHASEIAGRVQAVPGVDHVTQIRMRRFAVARQDVPDPAELPVAFDEIVLVENDPDHTERGSLTLFFHGGRA